MNDPSDISEGDRVLYEGLNDLDFSLIAMGMKELPFFKDDLYLGMQAMNIGIVDSVITDYEYLLLEKWIEIERTPTELALAVSAMSQMWIFGLYEVLRMWRDRRYQFQKLYNNSGIDQKLSNTPNDEQMNFTLDIRKKQLLHYKESASYRSLIDTVWEKIENIYRIIELFRLNLAKHCAPGKKGVIPRAPGYGRINQWCGALDYELIEKKGYYITKNRRDIADSLRACIKQIKQR